MLPLCGQVDIWHETLVSYHTSVNAADGVPPDGTPLTVFKTGELLVIVVRVILTVMTTVFIIVCLGFNIIFRNKRSFSTSLSSISMCSILFFVCVQDSQVDKSKLELSDDHWYNWIGVFIYNNQIRGCHGVCCSTHSKAALTENIIGMNELDNKLVYSQPFSLAGDTVRMISSPRKSFIIIHSEYGYHRTRNLLLIWSAVLS